MSAYPFVPAWYNGYGPRKGPTLGLLYHMAEGGGTVGYLDKSGNPPSRGVSVHAVCEYSGRVVQMLKWGDASGSLNPVNRSSDKAFYGHSHLVDVLGDWWTDPNSATISMEIEGFAAKGPNAAQVDAATAWGLDMRARYPSIHGALGHADQTDTKGCPGMTAAMRSIFDAVGGHGLFPVEDPMLDFSVNQPGGPSGSITVLDQPGVAYAHIKDGALIQIKPGTVLSPAHPVKLLAPLNAGPGDRQTAYLFGDPPSVILAQNVAFTPAPVPVPDCTVAINLEYDRVVGGSSIAFPPRT